MGTAGCLSRELFGGVYNIGEVIERDMMTEPLAPRGVVPFDCAPASYNSNFGTYRCATGDSFVTERDPWLQAMNVDFVDMELFAIAKVASRFDTTWHAIKFASDFADGDAAEHWNQSLLESTRVIEPMVKSVVDRFR